MVGRQGCRVRPTGPVLAASAIALLASSAAVAAPQAIEGKKREVAELQRTLAEFDARAGEAAVEHNRALDRLDAVRGRLRVTRVAVRGARIQLSAAQGRLADRLVGLYVQGEPDLIEVLLQTGSVSAVADVGELLQATARKDAASVATVRERRRRLEALGRTLAEDERRATAEEQVVRDREATLRRQVEGRRDALAGARSELRALIRAEEQRLARLAAQKRAAAAAARAQAQAAEAATGSIASLPGGSHVYPLAGPSTFSDDWLAPRAGGRYHEGIDLFAERGTPVVAVADGTLFRVGYSGISGNRLWLRDAAGTEFFYAHLDSYAAAAREGALVSKGTVIGYNGDTGDARGTPPHVHFQIHPGGGGPVRPYPIVSAWPRAG